MTTKLTKPVSRELTLTDPENPDRSGPVVVTITQEGLELRRKGSSVRKITIDWESMNQRLKMPEEGPAKFFLNPIGWLVE